MRRLIVAPHMDDESLGCGGLLAKHPDECSVVVLTDSGAERRAEHRRAMAGLGITQYSEMGFPDGGLSSRMLDLVTRLDALLAQMRPEEVYLPYPSLHQDHIAAYEGGMRACRASMTEGHWFVPTVLVYDIAAYDVSLYPTDLRWNVFETLTEEQVDAKVAACHSYVSEMPAGIHPMTSIKEIAAGVGTIRLVPYAEQYALVRQVRP